VTVRSTGRGFGFPVLVPTPDTHIAERVRFPRCSLADGARDIPSIAGSAVRTLLSAGSKFQNGISPPPHPGPNFD